MSDVRWMKKNKGWAKARGLKRTRSEMEMIVWPVGHTVYTVKVMLLRSTRLRGLEILDSKDESRLIVDLALAYA